MPRTPRHSPAAIRLDTLPPAMRDLLDAIEQPAAAASGDATPPSEADPAPGRSRLARLTGADGGAARHLTPLQFAQLGTRVALRPEVRDDDRLWWAEETRLRVGKTGIQFDGAQWWAPEMVAFTTGRADGPRARLVIRYDAAARAEHALREIAVYQVLPTGERVFLCRAVRHAEAISGIDVAAFQAAREEQLRVLLAKRAAKQHAYHALVHDYDIALETLTQQAERARRQARSAPAAEVATPVSAADEARRRRALQTGELLSREAGADRPAAPITHRPRGGAAPRTPRSAVPALPMAAEPAPPRRPRSAALPEAPEPPRPTQSRRRKNGTLP